MWACLDGEWPVPRKWSVSETVDLISKSQKPLELVTVFFLAEVRGSNNKRKTSLANAFQFLTKESDLYSSDTAKDETLLVKAGVACISSYNLSSNKLKTSVS